MIVPMKKVSIVLLDKDRKASLKSLRRAGVLHLEESPAGSGDNFEELSSMYSKVVNAVSLISASKIKSSENAENKTADIQETIKKAEKIISIEETIKNLHTEIDSINAAAAAVEPFGDFEPADIEILKNKGIDILLFDSTEEILEEIRNVTQYVFVLRKQKKEILFAAVFLGEAPEKYRELSLSLPQFGINELHAMVREKHAEIEKLKEELENYGKYREELELLKNLFEQELEFEALATGISGDGTLLWLTGYIPEEETDQLKELASSEGWALLIKDPESGDNPPTLIRNKPYIRIIKPVFDFLGTVPGYREYDISFYFLSFFTVFFAMIIGDAGYGTLFLLSAVFLTYKSKKSTGKVHDAVRLLYVLSIATIVWGAITGNWFGSRTIVQIPFFKSLVIPQITSFPDIFGVDAKDPQTYIMWFCFILGLSQLVLAHVLNFFKFFPKLSAFSYLGWGTLIGGLYFVTLNLVFGMELPKAAVYLIAAGLGLIVVFGEQGEDINFFKGLIKGIGGLFTTFLDAISGFSNIISYIRLFAVGMSSFYIASSFNSMASGMLKGWTIPVGIIIILIGHGLNLMMGLLAVIVHGTRLNLLEFSGQLGMEWTGIEYNPFRVRISEDN